MQKTGPSVHCTAVNHRVTTVLCTSRFTIDVASVAAVTGVVAGVASVDSAT